MEGDGGENWSEPGERQQFLAEVGAGEGTEVSMMVSESSLSSSLDPQSVMVGLEEVSPSPPPPPPQAWHFLCGPVSALMKHKLMAPLLVDGRQDPTQPLPFSRQAGPCSHPFPTKTN